MWQVGIHDGKHSWRQAEFFTHTRLRRQFPRGLSTRYRLPYTLLVSLITTRTRVQLTPRMNATELPARFTAPGSNRTYIPCAGTADLARCAAILGHERGGCFNYRIEGAPPAVKFICTCARYAALVDPTGQPCLDEECVVGATKCTERSWSSWLLVAESSIIVAWVFLVSFYALYICIRTCAARACTRNITNTTLAFTTLAAVFHLSWVVSDLVQIVTIRKLLSIIHN